jgi:quinol monooxygenase YgiN
MLVVLAVTKYNIHPDKIEAYRKWTQGAIKRLLAVQGVLEFRAYRGVIGTPQVQTTLEFRKFRRFGMNCTRLPLT